MLRKLLSISISVLFLTGLAWADDLNLTFEDASDVANWSHGSETNQWTAESHDATAGVGGSGALKLNDAGYGMLAKRAITATVGTMYKLTIDLKTVNWDDKATYPIYVTVDGIDATPDTVYINGFEEFMTVTLTGTANAADGFIRIAGSNTLLENQVYVDNVMFDQGITVPNVFFSEYIEGSSNNKALEIYNPTNVDVDLTYLQIGQTSNGSDVGEWEYFHSFPTDAKILAEDVWVIANDAADQAILDAGDEILGFPSPVHHNGDDARSILFILGSDTVVVDVIGETGPDPGNGWDVAGISNATQNHTLVRKSSVVMGNTNWAASAGTDEASSEWMVKDINTFDYIGSHGEMAVSPINVTMVLNTSTNLDTLTAGNGHVEMRGSLNEKTGGVLPDDVVINWGDDTELQLESKGGDYWAITFKMMPEDTLRYKFFTGFGSAATTTGNGGWESGFNNNAVITGENNRVFISGAKDTTLQVQYYNYNTNDRDQYWQPFESKTDSIAVYFRVNMAGVIESGKFDPATSGDVGVRGDNGASGQSIDWGTTKVKLTREMGSAHDDGFWSGVAYIDMDSVDAMTEQQYKFVADNGTAVTWEDTDNRTFTYPKMKQDTTLSWVYFDNKKPTGVKTVTSNVTWRVSTEALEALGLFDRGVGDKIEIRGPKGWGTGEAIKLDFNSLLQEWTAIAEIKNQPGNEIGYKYFVSWDSSRADSNSANYIPNLTLGDGWEEPAVTGGGNRFHIFEDASEQSVTGDFGFDRQFFNGVPANGVIDHDITVTWSIDMTKATNATDNPDNASKLFRPGTDSVWVEWNLELMSWTQGTKLSEKFLLLEDTDGDSIYTGSYTLEVSDDFPNVWYQLGYVVTYSTAEKDVYVTNGGGFDKGRRYYQYIRPTSVKQGSGQWLDATWPSEYKLETVEWKATDLTVETPPDLTVTSIKINDGFTPNEFALSQNYPNPFNPTTTIEYALAKQVDVSIKIYNVVGQEVAVLVNEMQAPGKYKTEWNGRNVLGKEAASGVYFLKFEAGNFVKFKKMTLLR